MTNLLIIKHINCVHDLHLKPVSHRVADSDTGGTWDHAVSRRKSVIN